MEPRIAVSSSDLTCKFYSTPLGKHLLSARPQRWGPRGSYSHQHTMVDVMGVWTWPFVPDDDAPSRADRDGRTWGMSEWCHLQTRDRKCVCAVEAECRSYSFFVSKRISEHSLYMARPCVKCSWAPLSNVVGWQSWIQLSPCFQGDQN